MRRGVGVLGLSIALLAGGGCRDHKDFGFPDASDVASDGPIDGAGSGSGSNSHVTGIGGPPVGSCTTTWCEVLPLPQANPYTSVWGSSHDNIWATTAAGLFHYDGTVWTAYNPSEGWTGGTLWGTSSDDLWISAAKNNVAGIYHWNGTGWDLAHASVATQFGQTGASSFWVANATGTLEYDGTTWTDHPLPSFAPLAIGGSGGTAIAVSNTGTIAQWVGVGWGTTGAGSHPCNAAAVIDSTHVVIAQNGDVAFWNGSTWTSHTPPVTAEWDRITARSTSDVWIWSPLNDYRYHWNGTTWSPATDPAGSGGAMWETTAGDLIVATPDAQVRMWTASSWSPLTIGTNTIYSAWGTAPDDIWARGGTTAYHWDGTAWTLHALPAGYTELAAMWASGPSDYWIAAGRWVDDGSEDGVIYRALLHWDGTSWTSIEGFGTDNAIFGEGFVALWGTGPDDIYAVGRTVVYHRDATGWSLVTPVTSTAFFDVFGTSATDVYILDTVHIWHYDGITWTMKTTPATVSHGVANTPADIWLTNGRDPAVGTLIHYDGTFFVDAAPTLYPHAGALFGTATRMFTINTSATTEWTGGFGSTPTQTLPQLERNADMGWVAPDGHVWAVGQGVFVHKDDD